MHTIRLSTLSHHLRHDVDSGSFYFPHWNCCALGHACRIPEFNDAGLHMCLGVPTYGDHSRLEASMAFFGLSEPQARELFVNGTPATEPIDVAEAIDRLVGIEQQRRAAADVAAVTADVATANKASTPEAILAE